MAIYYIYILLLLGWTETASNVTVADKISEHISMLAPLSRGEEVYHRALLRLNNDSLEADLDDYDECNILRIVSPNNSQTHKPNRYINRQTHTI